MNLYHMVPKDMRGDTLHSLNDLKEVEPDLYDSYMEKYKGREIITNKKIPFWGEVVWNDALFLSPVSPEKIRDVFIDVGFPWTPRKWFVFDSEQFKEGELIYFLPKKFGLEKIEDTFEEFRENEEYTKINDRFVGYLKMKKATGAGPLLFAELPHVLYKGSLSTRDIPVIEI